MFDALPLATLDDLILFTLVLARVAGIFAAIPLFGASVVPTRIKVPLIFAMALVLFPIVPARTSPCRRRCHLPGPAGDQRRP